MRNIMDLAGVKLVISSCWWITGGWNEENELWSINLFIHHYPLSHAPSDCLSVSACVSVCLFSALDYTEAVQRSLKATSVTWAAERIFLPSPLWVLKAGQSSTLMISPILGFGDLLTHQVRGRGGRDVRRGQRGLIRIFLSQRDDPSCQVTVLESSRVWCIFRPQQGVETLKGDVERERAIKLPGSGRAGLVCVMARGVWRAIKGPVAHVCPPPCQLYIIGEWQPPSQQHCNAYWFIEAKPRQQQ